MLAELVNGLIQKGHDVKIVMPKQGEVQYIILAPIIRSKDDHRILENDFPEGDIIVSNFYSTVPQAEAASRNGKGTHVRLSLCYEPTFLPDNGNSFRSYQLTNHVVVLSKAQQQLVYINHGIKGYIVPVGISSSFKNMNIRQQNDKIQISAILRKPEEGHFGHLEQEYLLEQLDYVRKQVPNVGINLLCQSDEYATSPFLQGIKRTNKYSIFLTENETEMNECYNKSHIFVNSSTYDSASIPGLEAMKCGTALVTTYTGGNMDYCRHGQNCLMSYRYENRLGHDIMRLLLNPPFRSQLAKKGEEEAKKWTWNRSTEVFETTIFKIKEKARDC
jgi:glycosyltransferase involved in cell wall biosynthesis